MNLRILVLAFMCISFQAFSQAWKASESKLNVTADFGSTKFNNTASTDVGDNINVGLSLGVTRVFENNLYVSSGVTFSTFKSTEFWVNSLDYFSVNANVGYQFNTGRLTVPYLALGTSFIKAVDAIPNASNSFSFNVTGGFVFWLKDSKYGLTMQNTYKFASSDSMVSHNQITFGVAYKL